MDALPSLPRVLIRILDVLQDDNADPRSLSDTILKDIGVTSRVISVASASLSGRGRRFASLEHAVRTLGLPTVKALVITAAMQQAFERYSPRKQVFLTRIWQRALSTASLSKVLAVLTSYPRPEEAYLAGLLADAGRLVDLAAGDAGDERREAATIAVDGFPIETGTLASHPGEVAAALMESWGLSPFAIDAVRYHLEPADKVRDAHHLVKVVKLAYVTASSEFISDQAIETADLLFGLNEGLTRELHRQVRDEVARLATALQIHLPQDSGEGQNHSDRRTLGERLQNLEQMEYLRAELAQVEVPTLQRAAVQRALFLTLGVETSLLFLTDREGGYLRAWLEEETEPTFVLQLEAGRSLVTDALLNRRAAQVTASERDRLSVVDRQIFGVCSADALWIQPLVKKERNVGALVLGLAPSQLARIQERAAFVQALGSQIVKALTEEETPAVSPEQASLERHIREMVHEASNPLSIIQNYLAMLGMKLGEEHHAQLEIGVIREEIERVGRILMRMREPPRDTARVPVALNEEVRRIAGIFAASVGVTRNLSFEVDLSPANPPLQQPSEHVRQILTNLLKNAVEALDGGGRIRISTRHPVSVGGRRYTELVVEDDGPGLPPQVMDNLFSPVESTKGKEHPGLGLSIVKRLVDDMDALIVCTSSPTGTRFQLLLPHARGK